MSELSSVLKQRRKELGLTLAQIADAMGVAEATVQRWESGNIKSIRHEKISKLAEILMVSPSALMGWEQSESLPANIIPMPEMRKIPLLGTIACGAPVFADEHMDGEVDIPSNIHADFALVCKGDSMINAGIFDGDQVLVKQQSTAENGDMVVALIDDSATVKTFYKENGYFRLQPENDTMEPIILNEVTILGKAIGLYRTF